jgi:hypothetical protein
MNWNNIASPVATRKTDLLEWSFAENTVKKPKDEPVKYISFDTPPLALVCAMIGAGKPLEEIHTLLSGDWPGHEISQVVEEEHYAQADKIYKYFAYKHTLRRLNGKLISQWMSEVDELCETTMKIKKSSLKILITLPKFYKENRELETLMRDYVSAPSAEVTSIDEIVTFVKKIERRAAGNTSYDAYYWKTDKNHLVRVTLPIGSAGKPAWEFLSKQGKFRIKSSFTAVCNIIGYDFNIIIPSSDNMEILTV